MLDDVVMVVVVTVAATEKGKKLRVDNCSNRVASLDPSDDDKKFFFFFLLPLLPQCNLAVKERSSTSRQSSQWEVLQNERLFLSFNQFLFPLFHFQPTMEGKLVLSFVPKLS